MENNNVKFDLEEINKALKKQNLEFTIENLKTKRGLYDYLHFNSVKISLCCAAVSLACACDVDYLSAIPFGCEISLVVSYVYIIKASWNYKKVKNLNKVIKEKRTQLEALDSVFCEDGGNLDMEVGKTLQKRYSKRRNIGI